MASVSVVARRLGGPDRPRKLRVRLVQEVERRFQFSRAGADLVLEHDRALELFVSRAAVVRHLLDPAHQHFGDLEKLLVLPLDGVGGVRS